MTTISLEIEDSKVNIVLNLIKNLRKDIIKKYHISNDTFEIKDFTNINKSALKNIWDNDEDEVYNKYLKV